MASALYNGLRALGSSPNRVTVVLLDKTLLSQLQAQRDMMLR